MNKAVFIAFILFSGQLIGQTYAFEQMLSVLVKKTVIPVKVGEAKNAKNTYFFDTRTKSEFEVSHIRNAQWIGFEEFKIGKLKNIPKNAEIILYCSVGYRSEKIGEKLLNAGYSNVKNLWGGIFEWVNESNPVIDKNNKITKNVHAYSPEWGIWLQKGEKIYK
jgi:rhodanese-related sulfurtransferase